MYKPVNGKRIILCIDNIFRYRRGYFIGMKVFYFHLVKVQKFTIDADQFIDINVHVGNVVTLTLLKYKSYV